MIERLTTLAAVKQWLGIDNTNSDSLLTSIIDAASRFTLAYLNRDTLKSQSFTENFYGNGKDSTLLKNWPILSVTSVGVNGTLISSSTLGTAGLPSSGYTIKDQRMGPQAIDLHGYRYTLGAPCQVIYKAGFETSESVVLKKAAPADTSITVVLTYGRWLANSSVTINGVTATKVSGSPAAGQYAVDEWGTYTFNVADENLTAVITYSYAPWDIAFAVTQMVGEWFKKKDRIGFTSKSLSGGVGESVTFSQEDMTKGVRAPLQQYRNVVPM